MTTIPAFAARLLRTSGRTYAVAAAARLRQMHPEFAALVLSPAFGSPIDDMEARIQQLAASVEFDRVALLEHSARWYRVAFAHRGVPIEYLTQGFVALQAVLGEEMPSATVPIVHRHLQRALDAATAAPSALACELDLAAPHGRLAANFLLAVLEGRGDDAIDDLRAALAAGAAVAELHDHVIAPVQREAGRMWLMGEIPIADEHHSSQIVDRALWLLHERLPRPAADAPVIATMSAGGNLHDLGIRIVAQRLQLAGYAVLNLGANMPVADLEWTFQDRRIDLLAISATMSLHVHALAEAVELVRRITHGRVPVLVGGVPFRVAPDLAACVGADAGAHDAEGAVRAVQQLLARP